MSKKKTDKRKKSSIELAAQSGAASEVVDRYGSAVKEHYVAYSGLDNENGRELTKGLKKVSQSKINPDTRYQNIKQQAGYAAEIKYTARQNTEKIIKKEDTRYSRTDDFWLIDLQISRLRPSGYARNDMGRCFARNDWQISRLRSK